MKRYNEQRAKRINIEISPSRMMDESGEFGRSVKIDNIDWEAYEKQRESKSS